ncbi:MAG TPA: hypothetical protein ENI85_02695 [Deltaproteobacteria bacterium]|nr:hypothetical protein [Deltaproteobacteria bacterium]
MKADSLRSRWFLAVAPLSIVILFVLTQFDFVPLRPGGTVEDLTSLKERDDVNVLFILIDTLRADRLSCYGYERETSPNIDALARNGIRFANHRSQSSWTKASMASLWTSLYPARTGVLRYSHAIPEEAMMPAEVLREAGFRTAAIWRNGWVAPNFGFAQGFEFYTRPVSKNLPREARRENPAVKLPGSDLDVARSAEEFMRTLERDERWFLYLHLMDVHQYVSDLESARFGTTYSDFYDNAIHWTDRIIGSIVDTLRRRRLLDRTIVVIASDHGEAFLEHGTEGHARNVYGEVTRTPLIVSLPFSLEEGIVVETPSQNVDIWPTLLELLDGTPQPESDGRSLVADIRWAAKGRQSTGEERLQVSHLDGTWGRMNQSPYQIIGIAKGRYRGISNNGDDELFELYDLETDPDEQHDLSDVLVEKASEFRSWVREYENTLDSPWGAREIEVDDMLLNQLRALGYQIE